MLYIVATPIGNLKDITLRALEALKEVDGIICEDSRHASILLNHYQINKPLLVLNDFNEVKTLPQIINKLQAGENLALISDAGTPLISDPGFKLVRDCLDHQIEVDSLPGPSATITALTLSGLPTDKFFFLGYLPEKSGHRQKLLTSLPKISGELKTTFILYMSPHKLIKQLAEMQAVLGDIEVVLLKELTKIHQTRLKQPISQILEGFKTTKPRGEYTLLLTTNY